MSIPENKLDLLLPGEVMQMLRISRPTLWRWNKQGILKNVVINSRGDRLYVKQDILDFIESKSEK